MDGDDYELVREPKPKGYVRLTRRKAPSPSPPEQERRLEKKHIPACFSTVLWILALLACISIVCMVCLYVYQWFRDCKGLLFKSDWIAIWC